MTAAINAANREIWKLTDNRFRILVFSILSFAVMC